MHPTQRETRPIPVSAWLAAAALTAAWCAAQAWTRSGHRRVLVEGLSMVPTLRPGDRLLVRRGGRLREGDIVAVLDPRDGRRILIKRVQGLSDTGIEIRGDNPAFSTDSRTFGPVAPGAVIGRAVYRYAPRGRTGRLVPRRRPGP